jgi:hypothetical protein
MYLGFVKVFCDIFVQKLATPIAILLVPDAEHDKLDSAVVQTFCSDALGNVCVQPSAIDQLDYV